MRSSSLAPALAVLALAAPSARADDSETFFATGRTQRAKGDCTAAVVSFRRALELKPQGLGALRNVAECEEQLGQFASARTDWWNLRRAVLQSNEPKYAGWDRDAERAFARLEPRVARLTVRLTGADLDRVTVSVDGKPLDPRLVGVELERDLGPHTVEAAYGGAAPLVEKRTLSPGAHEVVTFVVPAAPAAAATPTAPASEGGSRPLRIAGIAALAAGGLGAIGAGVALGLRQSALSSFSVCAPSYQGCPSALRGELSKGNTASVLVNVFGAVAVAGIAAGIPLVVIGSRSGAPAEPRAAIRVVPAAGGALLGADGRF